MRGGKAQGEARLQLGCDACCRTPAIVGARRAQGVALADRCACLMAYNCLFGCPVSTTASLVSKAMHCVWTFGFIPYGGSTDVECLQFLRDGVPGFDLQAPRRWQALPRLVDTIFLEKAYTRRK